MILLRLEFLTNFEFLNQEKVILGDDGDGDDDGNGDGAMGSGATGYDDDDNGDGRRRRRRQRRWRRFDDATELKVGSLRHGLVAHRHDRRLWNHQNC